MSLHGVTQSRPSEFTPKLVSVLREGYGLQALRADALAGLTVAVVALPLSMAIAIASGLTPGQGLVSSVVGGFLVSLLGGSRHQIGGPAGAFIVLVAATVTQFGVNGMLLATMMSGVVLLLIGALRLGTFIRYIPYPVTVGFTAGIAAIIFASQVKELLGLSLPHEPGPLLPKLAALWGALPTLNPAAAGLSLASVLMILALRRWRPAWPSSSWRPSRPGRWPCRCKRSAPASAASRRGCRCRRCRRSRGTSSRRCCRRRYPSRCSAGSRAC
jgi:SulP family sulfate permease